MKNLQCPNCNFVNRYTTMTVEVPRYYKAGPNKGSIKKIEKETIEINEDHKYKEFIPVKFAFMDYDNIVDGEVDVKGHYGNYNNYDVCEKYNDYGVSEKLPLSDRTLSLYVCPECGIMFEGRIAQEYMKS